jgi:hypothetical protein
MTAARAARLEALGFAWDAPNNGGGISNEVGWESLLAKLTKYKVEHGDCNVPQSWAEDPKLANWVHNQRQNKKKLDRGEPSKGMTAARAAKLEAIGFAWDAPPHGCLPNDTGWEAQLARLKAYKAEHGDCNVPQRWADDPPLGQWVRRQRVYKRSFDRGEPSEGMTAARAAKLEALGFAWEPGWPAEVGLAAAARHPPGARVARVFGDGRWYEGTVFEAPWPPGHRWARWRRVRFDDGATLDVDTDAGPLHFCSLRTPRGKATKPPRAQPADVPAAGGSGSSTGPTGPETLRYRTMRTRQRCIAHIGIGL